MMNRRKAIVIMLLASIFSFAAISEAQQMDTNQALSGKQQGKAENCFERRAGWGPDCE